MAWRIRFDKNAVAFFNDSNGDKLRFTVGPYTKAKRPELVDMKITDYCAFACSFCLAPDTKVTLADFTEVRIADLRVGDVLVGFDEDGPYRVARPSTVEAVWSTRKPAFRIEFENGESVIASSDHRWLTPRGRWIETSKLRSSSHIVYVGRPNPGQSPEFMRGYIAGVTYGDGTIRQVGYREDGTRLQGYWRVAVTDVEILDRLDDYFNRLGLSAPTRRVFSPSTEEHREVLSIESRRGDNISAVQGMLEFEDDPEYRRGFVSGFFDAEGAADRGRSIRVYQKVKLDALDFVAESLSLAGFSYSRVSESSGMQTITLNGGTVTEFVQTYNPAVSRKRTIEFPRKFGVSKRGVRVTSVVPVGEMNLVDITTSTRTFFADGFATHNCYQGSTIFGKHAPLENILETIRQMSEAKVFEVALGGGEPTDHPDFIEILHRFREAGIVPNFTTKSLGWVKRNWSQIEPVVGAFAFSCEKAKDVESAAKSLAKIPRDRVNLHYVMGLEDEAGFVAFLRAAKKHNFRVTLLGYKTVGRGGDFTPHDYSNWIDLVRMLVLLGEAPTISIDTPLAAQYEHDLPVPKFAFHTKEGYVSAYIDAVQMGLSASSFDNEDLIPLSGDLVADYRKVVPV